MPVRLIDSLVTTPPIAEIFSDRSVLQAMLGFEVALARAEARINIIPQSAADAIVTAATGDDFDVAAMASAAPQSATPAIPVINALREKVRGINRDLSVYVHMGATSQDMCDTAMVLLLKQTWPHLHGDLVRVEKALRRLAEQHKKTVMLGRTLMRSAAITTFGLKAAGWLAGISRAARRLKSSFVEALVLQFGGPTGTLAGLGSNGLAVAEVLARDLGLTLPEAPWHTQRDRFAGVVCDCGVLVGCLGKMAVDIRLLMQDEVAEVAEPRAPGRGSSSSMPHKINPVGCTLAVAAASRLPGLAASYLSGMLQEHERAAGSWQAEWSIISDVIGATAMALSAMAEVAEGLTVDAVRMRGNIELNHGLVFADHAITLLSSKLGRENARKIVEDALQESRLSGRRFGDVLSENQQVKEHFGVAVRRDVEDPEQYLGMAEEFSRRLLVSSLENRQEGKE